MPISIKTTGPIGDLPPLLVTQTNTLQDMLDAISDEIDDAQGNYVQQIQAAIFSAIRYCEREPFYFNEDFFTSFAAVVGQSRYSSFDEPAIASAIAIKNVFVAISNLTKKPLRKITAEEFEQHAQDKAQGRPLYYSYTEEYLQLYPAPDAAYRIHLELAPSKLDEVKSLSQISHWFTEAFDLVKARAKYELFKNILQDNGAMQIELQTFREQADMLKKETSRRNTLGCVQATRF